jgi:uncharacterized protein
MSIKNRSTRIVIFAKAPIPGFCKTRLISALGAEGAALLAQRMLVRMVNVAQEAKLGVVELCVSPRPEDAVWQAMIESGVFGGSLEWSAQIDGDLGQRMSDAFDRGLSSNENVICVGTDCLDLQVEHLSAAAKALNSKHATIIPALDGGYVLLGLSEFDASLFQGIAWSTETVYQETLQRVASLSWSTAKFDALRDIDQPSDLDFLPHEFKLW